MVIIQPQALLLPDQRGKAGNEHCSVFGKRCSMFGVLFDPERVQIRLNECSVPELDEHERLLCSVFGFCVLFVFGVRILCSVFGCSCSCSGSCS